MTNMRKIGKYPQFKQIYYSDELVNKYTDAFVSESDYMKTTVWLKIRSRRLRIDDYKCQRCGSGINLSVHHLVYPDVWGEERIEDLVTLCANCHSEVHSEDKN